MIPAPAAPTASTPSGQTGAASNIPVFASSSPGKPRMVYLSSSTENKETPVIGNSGCEIEAIHMLNLLYLGIIGAVLFLPLLTADSQSCRQPCGCNTTAAVPLMAKANSLALSHQTSTLPQLVLHRGATPTQSSFLFVTFASFCSNSLCLLLSSVDSHPQIREFVRLKFRPVVKILR
jgi:hypothetical protein